MNVRRTYYFLFVLVSSLVATACGDESALAPKPRAYPRVTFPQGEYRTLDADYCNFTFEYPSYTQVIQDTAFFDEKPTHPCWFDILYPQFDARIHFSYKPAGDAAQLSELKNDAFELVDWHNKRASYIEEMRIDAPDRNIKGLAFDISGPAASPFQFYLTDEEKHFVRGALYFNTQVNADSLAPLYDFVKADIKHLIDTFNWE